MNNEFTVREILERWGLRVTGGTLKSPIRVSTGGETALDDDLFLVAYVEATEGFARARPVLRHRYSEGRPLGQFQVRKPGETLVRALIRLGWMEFAELKEGEVAPAVLKEFRRALSARMREQPYRPPSVLRAG